EGDDLERKRCCAYELGCGSIATHDNQRRRCPGRSERGGCSQPSRTVAVKGDDRVGLEVSIDTRPGEQPKRCSHRRGRDRSGEGPSRQGRVIERRGGRLAKEQPTECCAARRYVLGGVAETFRQPLESAAHCVRPLRTDECELVQAWAPGGRGDGKPVREPAAAG